MRSILISIMLVIVIIVLYEQTIGAPGGALRNTENRGLQVNTEIEGIDP